MQEQNPTQSPLAFVRRIELLVALVWEVRSHLATGRWRRNRRKTRRELRRLAAGLGDLQASALAATPAAAEDVPSDAHAPLDALHALLHDTLATPPASKAEIRALRHALGEQRASLIASRSAA